MNDCLIELLTLLRFISVAVYARLCFVDFQSFCGFINVSSALHRLVQLYIGQRCQWRWS